MLIYGYRTLVFSTCTLPAGAMPLGSGRSPFLYLWQFVCMCIWPPIENKVEAAVNRTQVIWMVTSYVEALNVTNANVRIYLLAYNYHVYLSCCCLPVAFLHTFAIIQNKSHHLLDFSFLCL